MIRCYLCGRTTSNGHVCNISSEDLHHEEQKLKPQKEVKEQFKSSPIPMLRKGQASDSISILQEKLKRLEEDIAKFRNEKPLGIKEVLPSLIKEIGQISSIISMIVRPTIKHKPKRERLAEEIADTFIELLNLSNAASINISPFIEKKLKNYENAISEGNFDKPEELK